MLRSPSVSVVESAEMEDGDDFARAVFDHLINLSVLHHSPSNPMLIVTQIALLAQFANPARLFSNINF